MLKVLGFVKKYSELKYGVSPPFSRRPTHNLQQLHQWVLWASDDLNESCLFWQIHIAPTQLPSNIQHHEDQGNLHTDQNQSCGEVKIRVDSWKEILNPASHKATKNPLLSSAETGPQKICQNSRTRRPLTEKPFPSQVFLCRVVQTPISSHY